MDTSTLKEQHEKDVRFMRDFILYLLYTPYVIAGWLFVMGLWIAAYVDLNPFVSPLFPQNPWAERILGAIMMIASTIRFLCIKRKKLVVSSAIVTATFPTFLFFLYLTGIGFHSSAIPNYGFFALISLSHAMFATIQEDLIWKMSQLSSSPL